MHVGNTPIPKRHLFFFLSVKSIFSVSLLSQTFKHVCGKRFVGFGLALLREKQQSSKESPDRQGFFPA